MVERRVLQGLCTLSHYSVAESEILSQLVDSIVFLFFSSESIGVLKTEEVRCRRFFLRGNE